MIVQCENCETRFHVADARIPAKGARVRCSRCHHRFHITPSSAAPAEPGAPRQGSAREPSRGGEAAREVDELDNPEFLFDKPEGGKSEAPRAKAAAPAPASVAADPDPESALREPPAPPEPVEPKTPIAPAEERIVESGGKTAQQMLDAGAPQLESTGFEIGGSLGGSEEVDDTLGSTFLGERSAAPSAAPAPSGPPARSDLDALAADLGEDEDSSFSDWDPLVTPAAPAGASPFSTMLAAAVSPAAAPVTLGARESVFDQPDLAPATSAKRRKVPEMRVFDPEAAGPAALILRIAAAIVGVALLAAAGRLLWLQRDAVPPAPEVVQAAGWVAADLETFLARDASGERVLIVRGNLFPEGPAAPPEIEVRLFGADGEALAESRQTWLERIDDAEVAPEQLALRLAALGPEIGALGQQVTGFTAVLRDPPPGVRRVEVALHARAMPPAGTATAEGLPAIGPQPEAVPPPATARPSSEVPPAGPPSGDVLPAAPAPE